ncbi:GIY-YIG nuclease family protein [Bacillus marasmi]|uniref:GIY-YIG nuclease family protein n=1 Tax=Bacillus marasmi TaxID=1926279 RepID=UPI0011CACE77|nr:GIY-YIG nuclease family protein [Bacillus marasmi]
MIERIDEEHVLYAVHLQLEQDHLITVGKLGTYQFKKGTYIYVGSAKRAIRARLNRHKKKEKVTRWHIDYLRPFCEITKIITYELGDGECSLAEKIRKTYNGTFPIQRFGASDCKCPSHLIYLCDGENKKEQPQP